MKEHGKIVIYLIEKLIENPISKAIEAMRDDLF
jgi:hypothetical protein